MLRLEIPELVYEALHGQHPSLLVLYINAALRDMPGTVGILAHRNGLSETCARRALRFLVEECGLLEKYDGGWRLADINTITDVQFQTIDMLAHRAVEVDTSDLRWLAL